MTKYKIDIIQLIKENNIPNGVYLTGFFSNYPSQQIIDDIFKFIADKKSLFVFMKKNGDFYNF